MSRENAPLDVSDVLRSSGIGLAIAHGSRVGGAPRPDSDLDIGVLAADGRPVSYARLAELARALAERLGHEVDVSDLSTPDAIFRHEVARSGEVLFEDVRGRYADFVARALVDYDDVARFVPELVRGVARAARGDGPTERGP